MQGIETMERMDSLCKDVKSYGWVKDAEDLYDNARAEQPRIERLSRMRDALARTIADYKAIKDYPEIPEWLTDGDRTEEIGDLEQSLATVKELLSAAMERAELIKSGEYDFASDEDEAELEEIPEELLETEEDRALDRADEERTKKFDRVFNWIAGFAIGAAAAFLIYRVLETYVF